MENEDRRLIEASHIKAVEFLKQQSSPESDGYTFVCDTVSYGRILAELARLYEIEHKITSP